MLGQCIESLHFLPSRCADELSHWVEKALKAAQHSKLCAFAVLLRFPIGVDDALAVIGEDGLGAAIVDVEG